MPFLLGFNKALALGHEQNLIAAMNVHVGVGAVIEVDYVDADLLTLVRETLARNVFGTVERIWLRGSCSGAVLLTALRPSSAPP